MAVEVSLRLSKGGAVTAAERDEGMVVGVGVVLLTCLDVDDGARGSVGVGREADGDAVFCTGDLCC